MGVNAGPGFGGSSNTHGGGGGAAYSCHTVGITPKKKTLEFDRLAFTYDYETKVLTVGPLASEEVGGGMLMSGSTRYDEDCIKEFKAALLALGLGTTDSGMVQYR